MYISHQGLQAMQDEHIARHLRWAQERQLIRMAEQESDSAGVPRRHMVWQPLPGLRALLHVVLGPPSRA